MVSVAKVVRGAVRVDMGGAVGAKTAGHLELELDGAGGGEFHRRSGTDWTRSEGLRERQKFLNNDPIRTLERIMRTLPRFF